jgi:CRISPR-associated endonuclease/helicase Cas3
MTGKGARRSQLLHDAERLYIDRAWSDIELAERLGVDRTTIYKTRRFMEDELGLFFMLEGRGRYRLDPQHRLANIRLTPTEALALYLGGRRLQQQTRTGQQPVASALEKLARALRQPMMENLARAAQDILEQEQDPRQVAVMEKLVEGWITGRKVRIWHRVPHGDLHPNVVSPYQLEPSVWGDGVYLIGHSEYHNGLATFKVARIERAAVTMDPFSIPDDFDSRALLQHAWGIWHTDSEPQPVRLRFSAYVTPRVKESVWHPSQTIRDLPEGGCVWEAQIAEVREMEAWVRGWGADVEVLGPEGLREKVIMHVRRLNRQYQLSTTENDPHAPLLRLWGKTTTDPAVFHPALYHMLDVGHVAQQLLSGRATPRWRRVLARALNADADTLADWLPWVVALHDIGKISVPFQAQSAEQRRRLEAEGVTFGRYSSEHKILHHTLMGHIASDEWAKALPFSWREVFLAMVAGHHGVYQVVDTEHRIKVEALAEPPLWAEWRDQARQVLRDCLLNGDLPPWPEPTNVSAAIAALNGFVILCDWLGSDSKYFKPRPHTPLLEYLAYSRGKAKERVDESGFFISTVSSAPTTFTDLFGWSPRPLQAAIDAIPDELLREPTLTIIEAPTGEGKTEAALTLARRIAAHQGSDELYVALPTTATSNAMYKRLQEHLRDRLGLLPDLLQLVHGQAFLVKHDLSIKPMDNGDGEPHPALTWFEPKKEALLAPFGVGTVDQAELAALNVRHNALRLVGLAGKVVILDEVHAYDTYMTTIIARMLNWLAALGSSVILLSATLPAKRRRELLDAYIGESKTREEPPPAATSEKIEQPPYPYLETVGAAGRYTATPEAEDKDRRIQLSLLHFTESDTKGKALWLLEQVKDGGCICWIANTVQRAQEIFAQLSQKDMAPADVDCALLHAAFPLDQRQRIEDEIADKYGKKDNGRRPPKGIVIGTQVLEQSLDIDFDVMVTDLAPIDLVLQRVGRLHRHNRDKFQRDRRASAHAIPRVYINYEHNEAGEPRPGPDKFYGPYLLLKSWEIIAQRAAGPGRFELPNDYRPLIEWVYDEKPPAADHPWRAEWDNQDVKDGQYRDEAELRLTNPPDPEEAFYESRRRVFREDEDSAAWMNAQTRYQERETITVIPIERIDATTGHTPTLPHVALDREADRKTQLALLERMVRISDPDIVQQIKNTSCPALFTKSPLLKRCYPLMLAGDAAEGLPLQLDPVLGLVIERKKDTKKEGVADNVDASLLS